MAYGSASSGQSARSIRMVTRRRAESGTSWAHRRRWAAANTRKAGTSPQRPGCRTAPGAARRRRKSWLLVRTGRVWSGRWHRLGARATHGPGRATGASSTPATVSFARAFADSCHPTGPPGLTSKRAQAALATTSTRPSATGAPRSHRAESPSTGRPLVWSGVITSQREPTTPTRKTLSWWPGVAAVAG